MGQLWVEAETESWRDIYNCPGPNRGLPEPAPHPFPLLVGFVSPPPMTPSPQDLARPPAGVSCPFIQESRKPCHSLVLGQDPLVLGVPLLWKERT